MKAYLKGIDKEYEIPEGESIIGRYNQNSVAARESRTDFQEDNCVGQELKIVHSGQAGHEPNNHFAQPETPQSPTRTRLTTTGQNVYHWHPLPNNKLDPDKRPGGHPHSPGRDRRSCNRRSGAG